MFVLNIAVVRFPLHSALVFLTSLLIGYPAGLFGQLPLPSVTPVPSPTVPPLPTQSPSPSPSVLTDDSLHAVITYGPGQVMIPGSYHGVTSRVGLDPNQLVTITLQFPVNRIGQPVAIQPLDGGTVIPGSNLGLSSNGNLQFQFQANQKPGLTQVQVWLGAEEYGLQFYVFDPNHPERNPRIPKATALAPVRQLPGKEDPPLL